MNNRKNKRQHIFQLFCTLFIILSILSSSILFNIQIGENQGIFNNLDNFFNPNVSAIQDITIITPENKTYTTPMSGYYPATYGFENDEDGSNPENWLSTEQSGCSIEVIDEWDGHKKVVSIEDTSSSNQAYIRQVFTQPRLSGTIEFYVMSNDTSQNMKFWTEDYISGGPEVSFAMWGGYWRHGNGI